MDRGLILALFLAGGASPDAGSSGASRSDGGLSRAEDGGVPVHPWAEAYALAEADRWHEAEALLTPTVDAEESPAAPLALLTRCALETGDFRRARLLAERGLLRFPKDIRFRRLDLAVLIERRAFREAAAAAKSLLTLVPGDPVAWRQLAAATLEGPFEPEERRAVLEAAVLARPDDLALLERHLRAQLLAEHRATAVAIARQALLQEETATPRFVELAVRAAEAAEAWDLAGRWLNRIPPSERTLALTLLEARIAIANADPRSAEAAFNRLIEQGQASSAVMLRAANLAEERGDFARAEALYARAAEGTDDGARVARLSWARLLLKIGSRERAQTLVLAYLRDYPGDAYARRLLQVSQSGTD